MPSKLQPTKGMTGAVKMATRPGSAAIKAPRPVRRPLTARRV